MRSSVSADDLDALRAAIGGGVVLPCAIALTPAQALTAGTLMWPSEHAHRVLHEWRAWLRAASEEVTSVARLVRAPRLAGVAPALRGRAFVAVGGVGHGRVGVADRAADARPVGDVDVLARPVGDGDVDVLLLPDGHGRAAPTLSMCRNVSLTGATLPAACTSRSYATTSVPSGRWSLQGNQACPGPPSSSTRSLHVAPPSSERTRYREYPPMRLHAPRLVARSPGDDTFSPMAPPPGEAILRRR
jgi:hypothetical protein